MKKQVEGLLRRCAVVALATVWLVSVPAGMGFDVEDLEVDVTDDNPDRVYFNEDTMGFTISGLDAVPDGDINVAFGVFEGEGMELTDAKVLEDLNDENGYFYTEETLQDGSVDVEGSVLNPDNTTLPTGLVGIRLALPGDDWQEPAPLAPDDDYPVLVGPYVPEGPVSMEPELSEIDNLYNITEPITFSREGMGSITFQCDDGLNIADQGEELLLLQDNIRIATDEDTLDGGLEAQVVTGLLTFLDGKGATIEFYNAMEELGLDPEEITEENFRDFIDIEAIDAEGVLLDPEDVEELVDFDGMSYNDAEDILSIPVNSWTTYVVTDDEDAVDDDDDDDDDDTCFIASAAYGTNMASEIDALRALRDEVLLKTDSGEAAVEAYYHLSPPAAEFIGKSDTARAIAREALTPIVEISREITGGADEKL